MRCKMCCGSKVNLGEGGHTLGFYAVYAGSKENDQYFKATPSAQFYVNTVNDEAASKFEVGKNYYVDLSAAA